MKMISAIIKHFRLDTVREALVKIGVEGLTITDVKGFGKQKGHVELYRGAKYEVVFHPKIKLDIAVSDERVDEVVKTITETARTGEIGDGKIFVYSLTDVVRIRTGESGESAL